MIHLPIGRRTVAHGEPPITRHSAGWLLVLAAGLAMFEGVRRALIATQNPALVPTLMLVGALAVPAAFVTFVYGRPLRYDVPATALIAVAVCGGVLGVIVAGVVEFDTLHRLGLTAKFGVATIEESAKLLVPVVVLVLGRWRRPADGLIIGVACGAGFAALETLGYAFTTLTTGHGDLSQVDGILMIRGALSPAGHMAWTGLTAAALWRAAAVRFSARACWLLAGWFGAALALHTAWDAIGTPTAYLVLAATGLGALTIVTHGLTNTLPAEHQLGEHIDLDSGPHRQPRSGRR